MIPYRALSADDIARPYVMCSLPGRAGRSFALVDSGADTSSVPLAVASALRIPIDRLRVHTAFGAGGEFTEYEADDDIVLGSEVGRILLRRPGVNAALPFIILGRRDFFDGRRVCFDQRARRIEIQTA